MPDASAIGGDEGFRLVAPAADKLDRYAAALARGWSPNNVNNTSAEDLAAVQADPKAFLDRFTFRGGTVTMPDGSELPRLPFVTRWMWDGDFCGSISARWQPGSSTLPEHVLGHIGYAVVPCKRRNGYATRALGLILPEARKAGLASVEITMDADNEASRRIVEANGGRFIEEFVNLRFGPERRLRYVIYLA